MEEMTDDGHQPATKADLRATQADVRATQADVRATQADVRATQADVRAIQLDVRAIQLDVRATQVELRDMRLDHGANLRRLNISFAQMSGDMVEMRADLDSLLVLKKEFSQFKNNIEQMTRYFESQVRKTDFLGSMMMEHEERIKKLESRPN